MKRILIVAIPLLVAPLVALSVLTWWLAGRVQDELLTAKRKQHEALLDDFERGFGGWFNGLAGAVGAWGEQTLTGETEEPPKIGASWFAVVDSSGRWLYPSAFSTASESDTPSLTPLENMEVFDDLSLALSYEKATASLSLATEKYEEILRRETAPQAAKARALFGLARCLQKTAYPERALQAYEQVMTDLADAHDETGLSFGAEASAAHLRLILTLFEHKAVDCWRAHADALLDGRYPMPPVIALGHLTETLGSRPSSANDAQDLDRQSRLEAFIETAGEINAAFTNIMAAMNSDSPRMERRGGRILLLQPLSSHRSSGLAVAGFADDYLQDNLKKIVQQLSGSDGGRLVVCSELDDPLFGMPMSTDAISARVSLTRWGLPWTVEAGFTDLDQIRQQGHQRHLLLTGFIAILIALITIGVLLALQMVRREIELSKLKSDFVDNVSHELRTPVTSIKMFSEMLQSGHTIDPARQQEYFRLLASESSRLARMIDNVLNFSRIMAGRPRVHKKPVDVQSFLLEQQEQLEVQARTTGHHLHLHLGRDLPVCSIDPDGISRALANLVSNATKYSSKEHAILVTAQRRDQMLSIMVRDRGVGIPQEDLPHVFERFYRSTSPDGEHIQGTGLGLTIVKDTVERHGGSIRIESRLGEGTLVELLLPIEDG